MWSEINPVHLLCPQYPASMLRLLSFCALATFLMPLSHAETILVHGHRGSRATRPENTLPAFEYAIQHGADVLSNWTSR